MEMDLSMWSVYAPAGIAAVAMLTAFAVAIWLLTKTPADGIVRNASEFSPDYYRPMARLLREDDFEYLASQDGYRPQIGRQLRSDRRRVFRGFLKDLKADFGALHKEARLALRDTTQDRPDLALALVRQSVRFHIGVWRAEAALVGHAIGLGPVDCTELVRATEWMRGQLELMRVPQVEGAAA
jgi:uncharacterized membrane protein